MGKEYRKLGPTRTPTDRNANDKGKYLADYPQFLPPDLNRRAVETSNFNPISMHNNTIIKLNLESIAIHGMSSPAPWLPHTIHLSWGGYYALDSQLGSGCNIRKQYLGLKC